VRVDSDDPDHRVVFGTLESDPVVMTDLRLGQELAVSYDNIKDHRTPNRIVKPPSFRLTRHAQCLLQR
jgi:hypothetical protein